MSALTTCDLIPDIPGRRAGAVLNIDFEPGQVWGVLGPNGAGKSTLLHTLAGLHLPRAGQVRLDGTPLTSLSRRQIARQLGLLFQDRHDGFPATVLETALIGRHPHLSPWQTESAGDVERAIEALKTLGLLDLKDRLISQLSGGERQRVALATLMTQAPVVWLADEPANHLDLHHQVNVMSLLTRQARSGATVIMSLHDLNLAARWCDHILLLYPDGNACWGGAASMLEPAALEALYGQRLSRVNVDGLPVFVPVAHS